MPNAVPSGDGLQNLQPLGLAGEVAHLSLAPYSKTGAGRDAPTSISLFDQGLVQVLQASMTGLEPKRAYVLAVSLLPEGGGDLQPLQAIMTNPARSAIVNTVGPIRQIVRNDAKGDRRFLVIAAGPQPAWISGSDRRALKRYRLEMVVASCWYDYCVEYPGEI